MQRRCAQRARRPRGRCHARSRRLDRVPGRGVRDTTFESDGRSFPVQLVRLIRPDGARTYVQWIASDRPGPRPVVVSTDPYGGIDWTGEAVELRWAGRAAGVYEDVDGPGYDGSAPIVYYPTTPTAASEQELPHLRWRARDRLAVVGAGGPGPHGRDARRAGRWALAARYLKHIAHRYVSDHAAFLEVPRRRDERFGGARCVAPPRGPRIRVISGATAPSNSRNLPRVGSRAPCS